MMTPAKRLLDIVVALALMAVLALPFAALLIWILIKEGGPLFHRSERMKTPTQAFQLWKLRTMRVSAEDGGTGVSGGDKQDRITPMGRRLRRTRLDEIPQLWNVLKGDMSFVGPRPPLRSYVERFPAIYGEVLQARPGITGLASLHYHRHEEWWLAQCHTPEETDAVYARVCVPRKAHLDRIYLHKRNICMDVALMWQTAAKVLPARGHR